MKVACWWILFLSINFFNVVVFSTQLFPSVRGGSVSRASHEPKYKIEFHPEGASFHPDGDQESLVMRKKNGEKYQCFLPKEEKSKGGKLAGQQNTSSLILEMERPIKLEKPDELLDVLKDLCFVRQEGWWTYEFCYQKKLRQIHVEDEKVLQEFILGEYDAAATEAYNQNLSDVTTVKDPRGKDASQRYHAHQYTNGTKCDLTNQPRETEVRFVCAEGRTMITSITELATCKYALTVQSPALCKHPLFQAEKPEWHTINCNKLPKEYKDEKVEDRKVQDENIFMITDVEPNLDSEGFAT